MQAQQGSQEVTECAFKITKSEYHTSSTRAEVYAHIAGYTMVNRLLGNRITEDSNICTVCAMVEYADDAA